MGYITNKDIEVRTGHDVGKDCMCVTNHTPGPQELHWHHIVPKYAGGPDEDWNMVWLCPTSHVNVHELLRAWEAAGGKPDWSIRKYYNPYIRDLARRGYEFR